MTDKVALLEDINPSADQVFEAGGFEVIRFPKTIEPADLVDLAHQVSGIGVRSSPKIPDAAFTDNPNLQAVAAYCVATDQMDKDLATENGVAVFNSAFENTRSVAELVVGFTFSLMRRLHEHNTYMHNGTWNKTDERSHEVRGKTVGIVGYGSIGSQVGNLLEAVGMNVRFYDPAPKIPKQGRAEPTNSLEELLKVSDVVTVHIPGNATIFDAETLGLMKSGSYLINTARGAVVDEGALMNALENGHLAGYAGDVFEDEPKKRGDDFNSSLRYRNEVLLTPHIGGSTIESQIEIAMRTSEKLLGYLATGTSTNSLNIPNLATGPVTNESSRLIYLHRNQPGSTLVVREVLADHGHNIVDSELKTNEAIGYEVIDVEPPISQEALRDIANLPETVRARVI